MFWGQTIKVYTDHQNLIRDSLGLTSDRVYRWRGLPEKYDLDIVCIPWNTNIVADGLRRLEYDQSMASRTLSVHNRSKALAKTLCRYVKVTSDYPEVMQTYNSTVPSSKITTVHTLHREYKYNHALVNVIFEVEKPIYVDETARQQEIVSRRYMFANRTAGKEDEVYP